MQLPKLLRAGAALQTRFGSLALTAPLVEDAYFLGLAQQLTSGRAPWSDRCIYPSVARGFSASSEQNVAITRLHADVEVASAPVLAEDPSKHTQPGRSCGFQHQFRVIGAVEGPYEIRPAAKFAVVEIGSHQFKVIPGDVIITEKINGVDINDKLSFSSVMMLGSATKTIIGRWTPMPLLKTACPSCFSAAAYTNLSA